MIKFVIMNGSGGIGKDTFIDFIDDHMGTDEYLYNISSVDKVKEAAEILGWNGGKSEEDRIFLHELKQSAVKYNDHCFKYIFDKCKNIKVMYSMCDTDKSFRRRNILVFIHIREPEEIDKLINAFKIEPLLDEKNIYTLLMTSNRVAKVTSNTSDKNVDNYKYDHYVENNGTLEELKEKAINFYNELFGGI